MRQSARFSVSSSSSAAPSAPSRRCLRVILLNKEEIQIFLEPKAKLQDIFKQVCDHIGLRECEYFGLAQLIDGEYQFLELDLKVSKIIPKSWSKSQNESGRSMVTIYFKVQYYVDHVMILKERVTRQQYYQQLKENFLHYNHMVGDEKCFQLASYALQVDHGNYSVEHQGESYFDPREYFPAWMLEKYQPSFMEESMPSMHQDLHGITKMDAQLNFIKDVSTPPAAHNLHFYRLKKRKGDPLGTAWIAICAKGIEIYEESKSFKSQLSVFEWGNIDKLNHEKKKFEIRAVGAEERKFTYYTDSDEKSKYLFNLCRNTHIFQSKNVQPKLAESKHLEAEDSKKRQYNEAYVYSDKRDKQWEREQTSLHSRRSLTLRGQKRPGSLGLSPLEARISIHSTTSSNTTSGIVSDRNHLSFDESEDEIIIDSPPRLSAAVSIKVPQSKTQVEDVPPPSSSDSSPAPPRPADFQKQRVTLAQPMMVQSTPVNFRPVPGVISGMAMASVAATEHIYANLPLSGNPAPVSYTTTTVTPTPNGYVTYSITHPIVPQVVHGLPVNHKITHHYLNQIPVTDANMHMAAAAGGSVNERPNSLPGTPRMMTHRPLPEPPSQVYTGGQQYSVTADIHNNALSNHSPNGSVSYITTTPYGTPGASPAQSRSTSAESTPYSTPAAVGSIILTPFATPGSTPGVSPYNTPGGTPTTTPSGTPYLGQHGANLHRKTITPPQLVDNVAARGQQVQRAQSANTPKPMYLLNQAEPNDSPVTRRTAERKFSAPVCSANFPACPQHGLTPSVAEEIKKLTNANTDLKMLSALVSDDTLLANRRCTCQQTQDLEERHRPYSYCESSIGSEQGTMIRPLSWDLSKRDWQNSCSLHPVREGRAFSTSAMPSRQDQAHLVPVLPPPPPPPPHHHTQPQILNHSQTETSPSHIPPPQAFSDPQLTPPPPPEYIAPQVVQSHSLPPPPAYPGTQNTGMTQGQMFPNRISAGGHSPNNSDSGLSQQTNLGIA